MSTSAASFNVDAAWRLSGQVALRPEGFGALAYHFGTRKLSFLKSPVLLHVVEMLPNYATARDACVAAGVESAELPAYVRALHVLAASGIIESVPA